MEHKAFDKKRMLLGMASTVFWLLLWQLAAMLIKQELFLVSPVAVIKCLFELMQTSRFYETVAFTLSRIMLGFVGGALVGTGFAFLAYKQHLFETLLRPILGAIKAAPVASFVVLALLAVGSKNLAALISFLMVLPVFYSSLLAALKSVEPERFEAAEVFGMLRRDRFRFIYLPYTAPHFASACQVGMGLAWKSGVSAEVIGITVGSIGEMLYESKLSLETDRLLAYTLVVVLISLLLEKLLSCLIGAVSRSLTK